MSALASDSSDIAPHSDRPPRPRRPIRRLLLAVVMLLVFLSVPPVFRGMLWVVCQEEVRRQGGELRIGALTGSLWEPLVLSEVTLSLPSFRGGYFQLSANQVRLQYRWTALLERVGTRPFLQKCTLLGGHVLWEPGQRRGEVSTPSFFGWGAPLPVPMPEQLDLQLQDATLRSGDSQLLLEDAILTLSDVAPGEFKAARMEVRSQGWNKSFRDLQGKSARQDGRLQLGDLTLLDGLKIISFTSNLSALAEGRADFELQTEVFGGELRVLAEFNSASQDSPLEASGTFSKLGVAQLASFLNVTEAAGGSLETGKFSFRGRPSQLERGTASLRLEARNFQWESRQWDALVLGATLLDHHIQVPEFSLRQGHNQLVLNGDMQWPGGDTSWWKADFGVNLTAKIDNLTELSALVLPEFKYAAGGLTVDGAIRSQAGVLGGALIVSGAHLTWRNAPIDELHAAVKLQGSEVQVLNVELAQGGDLLRGRGAVSVGENWTYRGELHGAVRDLSQYEALWQLVAARSYTGGLDLDWTGKGSAQTHDGTVKGRFRQFGPAGAKERWEHPMSGSFSGGYDQAGIVVDAFELGDEVVQLKAGVTVNKEGMRWTKCSLQQGQATVMQGEALLPPSLWKTWPKVDWQAWLKGSEPIELRMASKGMDLAVLGRLPGLPVGLAGTLEGEWELKGDSKRLEGHGGLQLHRAAWGKEGGERHSEVELELAWAADKLLAKHLQWRDSTGLYTGSGTLQWAGEQGAVLGGSASSAAAQWSAPPGFKFAAGGFKEGLAVPLSPVQFKGNAVWKISGPIATPLLTGDLMIQEIDFGGVPDLRPMWRAVEPKAVALPGLRSEWLRSCRLQLQVGSGEGAAVRGTTGAARVDLKATGLAGAPEWAGEVRLAVRAAAAGAVLEVAPWVVQFVPGQIVPDLEIHASGTVEGLSFQTGAVGPFGQTVKEYQAQAPLSSEAVRAVFEEGKSW